MKNIINISKAHSVAQWYTKLAHCTRTYHCTVV